MRAGEHWQEEIGADGSKQSALMSVRAELPDGGEFPNGQVYGADSVNGLVYVPQLVWGGSSAAISRITWPGTEWSG